MGDGQSNDVVVGRDVERHGRFTAIGLRAGCVEGHDERVGGVDASTVPTTSAMFEPSMRRCSQGEPTSQSQTLLWPQYSAVRSASVNACQTRCGCCECR